MSEPFVIEDDYIKAMMRKSEERRAAFAQWGIKANGGSFLGQLGFSAADADKMLKLLRELKRLRRKAKP